jgi:hypothetical protein
VTEVLVSVEHADGVAAVVRTRRRVELAGRLPRTGAVVDDDEPAIEGLAGDRTAVGGLLPGGAVGAEVVDDAGARHTAAAANGAWVIVLDQPLDGGRVPVRYLDAAGATVPAPLAGGERTPVPDAAEPCPACGACDWERVVPRPRRLVGAGSWQPGPAVACRVCGHAEDMGAFYGGPLSEGEAPPWPAEEGLPENEEPLPPLPAADERDRWLLGEAGFPVYAVPGRPAEVGVSGRHGDVLDRIELVHADAPRVTVTTERDGDFPLGEAARARQALADLHPWPDSWPDRSQPAVAIWIHARERDRRRVAATAELGQAEIRIDGEPARFTLATAEVGWAAVRRHADLLITVTARDCAPAEITLEPLVER